MLAAMKTRFPLFLLGLLLGFAGGSRLNAYPSMFLGEKELVKSDLIVIAHVKEGAFKKIKVPSHVYNEGPYEVLHTTLVVTTVLKGELSTKEVEIAIGSGLCLVDEGKGV